MYKQFECGAKVGEGTLKTPTNAKVLSEEDVPLTKLKHAGLYRSYREYTP